ncbi:MULTISPECIES: F0F1 ATP synthase subunit epsilon [Levilactobacillus]|uniref:ATP synthase epsilon chain n=2 Tax=Levilactobacillus TaxID=2767886 RepID=A0A0R1H5A9_9LACO|nr:MULTISPECIES: F0F1 ATP synthase subunit epsilon [Levilactobacillus]KRK39763.1 F0F1 ATP synthase subunit epsilon [Levilactobacillus parabrevis ATCC 53295]KRO07064.1 F0F1 ATP synthase subunit epsilon [Levilactobacillus parabrevis]MCT4486674.1 F0F1 ATP synthase subunit epsilon [Levilactobacillus parabrevis]MCT4489341.1 F0F1 ATP synthase subunit epsilon [Levilactobacillus parabrevis]
MADNQSVLSVSIVTPDGRVYENDGELLVIKTKLGQLGIMPNHVPVISSLEVDEVRVKHDGEEDEIAVNGGFLEFSDNVATIVADSAERQDDIDVGRAESARDRAQAAIKKAQEAHDDDTLARAEVALRRAINRINVANH